MRGFHPSQSICQKTFLKPHFSQTIKKDSRSCLKKVLCVFVQDDVFLGNVAFNGIAILIYDRNFIVVWHFT